jgi:phage recombination protein Bet
MVSTALVTQSFDKRQIDIMRRTIAKDTSPEEFAFFLEVCKYRGLNPFNREIYAVVRKGKMTIQMGIDGFRKLAERSGKYKGQKGPYFCGKDGAWKEEWLEDSPPVAAKVGILRADFDEPIWAVARYSAYVQLKDGQPTDMWQKFHDVLLSKCAESLAIRKAFPAECGGMYTNEEMNQADAPTGVVVGSISPISETLNKLYTQGKSKGLWKDIDGLYPYASAVLSATVTRDSIYELNAEQLAQLVDVIEAEPEPAQQSA